MSDHILTDISDHILTITFNRPEKKNAITRAMYATMAEALNSANDDSAVRVVLFNANGNDFTAGNDIQDFIANPPRGSETPVARFLHAIATAKKPLVAAVDGRAVGVGTTMLLHCDLVYAASSAMLHMPFVNLGLVPEAASSFLIPRLMGQAKAGELLLLGEPFSAAKGETLGMITAVLSPDELQAHAAAQAAKLATLPPAAVRQSKALIKRAITPQVLDTMQVEGDAFGERLSSPEAAEAFQAFMQRRKPDFSKFD